MEDNTKDRTKEKGLNYYRQTKGFGYKQPISHKITEETKYTFSKKGLVDLLQQYEDDSLNPSDFVETIIP